VLCAPLFVCSSALRKLECGCDTMRVGKKRTQGEYVRSGHQVLCAPLEYVRSGHSTQWWCAVCSSRVCKKRTQSFVCSSVCVLLSLRCGHVLVARKLECECDTIRVSKKRTQVKRVSKKRTQVLCAPLEYVRSGHSTREVVCCVLL
jgi:hypothetical protein